MVDIHSHILPQMDDGSSDAAETVELLKTSMKQGVNAIFATPHFSAEKENPEKFISRREQAFRRFEYDPSKMPQIFLGAEVEYFNGISHSESVRKLCLGESSFMLLEMPFSPWTNRMIDEVCNMQSRLGITPIIAHVERYLRQESSSGHLEKLLDNKIYFQSNASFFTSFFTRRKALSMLRMNVIHFLGSDCHNMSHRQPNLGLAADIISKKMGISALEKINDRTNKLFCTNEL